MWIVAGEKPLCGVNAVLREHTDSQSTGCSAVDRKTMHSSFSVLYVCAHYLWVPWRSTEIHTYDSQTIARRLQSCWPLKISLNELIPLKSEYSTTIFALTQIVYIGSYLCPHSQMPVSSNHLPMVLETNTPTSSQPFPPQNSPLQQPAKKYKSLKPFLNLDNGKEKRLCF